MATSEKTGCTSQGKEYAHGAEVCQDEKCKICNSGKWEEKVELFPPEVSPKPAD